MQPADYLNAALTYIRENAYFVDNIAHWQALHRQAHEMIQSATTTADTYPAIEMALAALEDHHSFLRSPQTDSSPSIHGASPTIHLPQAQRRDEHWGYITLPNFSGSDEQAQQYAKTGQQLICDMGTVKGWIVDFRLNTGGNMFPMLAVIGPLAGEGVLGSFVTRAGNVIKWGYRDGTSFINDEYICAVTDPAPLIAQDIPIALLVSKKTGSSGEITLISFLGRPNVCMFGTEATHGIPTANETLNLPDGASIALTIAITADRTGKTYQTRIEPDVLIEADDATASENSPVLAAALEWLRRQAG